MVSSRVLLSVCFLPGIVFCWWPFSSQQDPEEPSRHVVTPRKAASFEMMSAEQKFLSDAQQFLDLAPLDQCLHGVVSRLRQSCSEMSEEDLGKLSVELLNCQSAAEARQTFTCTQDMSLAECTQPMDAHTWNTYHIISNRARSVCYATRQQQFRRQTEMAVNKLSAATIEQLQAMEDLASSQHHIKQTTEGSLKSLQEHQNHLLKSQREILASQDGAREKLTHNLKQLIQEKELINSGQEQLTNMTLTIHQQLEEAASLLGDQEHSMRKGHQKIQEDISRVSKNIQQVWERVDSSTAQMLKVIDDMGSQYQATLENLRVINSSVTSMMNVVINMHTVLSSQLEWLINHLGGAQDGLRVLTTLATHSVFLVIAILCVLFLKAPALTRLSLLIFVSVNVAVEIKYKISLTFVALAGLQMVVMFGNWAYLWYWPPRDQERMSFVCQPPALTFPVDFDNSCQPNLQGHPETLTHTPVKTSTKVESTFLSVQCERKTRLGTQCKLPAVDGGSLCRRHARYC